MKSKTFSFLICLIFTASCSPSEEIVQTAIARTEESQSAFVLTSTQEIEESEKSGLVIGRVRYQLPSGPGWCLFEKSTYNGMVVHYLTSFCFMTDEPFTTIDIYAAGQTSPSCASAIERFYDAYIAEGFTLLDLQYRPNDFSGPIGSITNAKAEMSHPEIDEILIHFISCYEVANDHYILIGRPAEYSEDAIFYVLDSMDEIVQSMEKD